jgi:uncharacterized protein
VDTATLTSAPSPVSVSSPDAAPAPAPPAFAPVSAAERIAAVDIVRGIAVLGILLMNIVGFAFPLAAYADPTVAGGATGIDFWVYALNAVLVDGKMRGIFSICFGAGVVILTSRAFERGAGADAADVHYRRMFWLMLFGVLHAYLLWWGEILYPYALIGLFLYPMRKASPRALWITGGVLALLLTLGMTGEAFNAASMRDKAAAADAAAARGETLTEEQLEAQRGWKERMKMMKPDAQEIARVTAAFQGSYLDVVKEQAKLVAQFHFTPYYFPLLWDMLLMMLFGMAMVKTGVLSAERSYGFYTRMALASYAIGLPLSVWFVQRNVAANFDHIAMGFNNIIYGPARIAVCLGHVAVVMLVVKAGALPALTSRLAAVGQMAFSNYILQSVICATIFYGFGFGLYNTLERHQVYYVVLGCCLVHLLWSPVWLRHYRFGPLEWCWRSLTYWQRQPMRRTAGA